MCQMVWINDGPECETQAELKRAMGDLIYLPNAPVGAIDDADGCLCWVDVEAMARRDGYDAEYVGDWKLTKA